MPNEDRMTVDERRKYLKLVVPRYAKARRTEGSELLTEMGAVTGLHRKSLLRLLHGPTLDRAPKRPRVRRRRYGAAVADVVRVVWESLDYVCAERLTPALLRTARQLTQWQEVVLTPDLAAQLATISRATVQRLLQRLQQDTPKLPRRKAQPPNRLPREVPMERLCWETTTPGSFEADLVHHCGPVAAGEYVHTLQLVDIATGWSERVAVLGRSQAAMVAGFQRVQARLPFPITHLHPDNGSEFFNHHLIRYFGEEMTGLRLSRSRPYRKNDNRFVEQKNATLVRAYTGYDRLDSGRPSMPSMTNSGCTTTCSSRYCTWRARRSFMANSGAGGTRRRHPTSGSWPAVSSHHYRKQSCPHSMLRPTHDSCGGRSIRRWKHCGKTQSPLMSLTQTSKTRLGERRHSSGNILK